MEYFKLTPFASPLMESLRDFGYSLETAIADIIDNSITARAKKIHISTFWDSESPYIAIADDGQGMTKNELIESMRFGSANPTIKRDYNDLGRFGLGLKTASLSQCRCLTVMSKKDGICNCAKWDMDKISFSKENDQWSLCLLSLSDINSSSELLELKEEYLDSRDSGTIILWQQLDRIEYGDSVKSRETRFNQSINSVRHHLELVFHRFLLPEKRKPKVEIYINKSPLEAFDPFNVTQSTELHEESFLYENERIYVQPYILPHHNKTSKDVWKKYEGEQGYVHEQGFYVYRNCRLIIYGTWFKLIRKEELTKLIRVRVDIPNSLDHLWKIDVKKSHAFPPAGIRDQLKRIIGEIQFAGKNVYRQRGQRLISDIQFPAWERTACKNQIFYKINREHPLLKQHISSLNDDQLSTLLDILGMLESAFPKESFFSDVAANPEQVSTVSMEYKQLEQLLDIFLDKNQNGPSQKKLREILQTDPFASNKDLTETIYKDRRYEY